MLVNKWRQMQLQCYARKHVAAVAVNDTIIITVCMIMQSNTVILHRSWPACLEGRDVQAVAEPGSGKTLGYLLPAVPVMLKSKMEQNAADSPEIHTAALILAPTR